MSENYHSEKINSIIDSYKHATIAELWDTPEEIEEYYQNDKNYSKLLNEEEEGYNVIQHHQIIVISRMMSDWINFVVNQTL